MTYINARKIARLEELITNLGKGKYYVNQTLYCREEQGTTLRLYTERGTVLDVKGLSTFGHIYMTGRMYFKDEEPDTLVRRLSATQTDLNAA